MAESVIKYSESWIKDLEIANNKEELQALTRPINTRHLILCGDSNVTDKEFRKLLAWGYITKLTIIGNDALTDEGFSSAIRGIKGLEELHLERVHGVTQNGLMKALHGSAIVSCGKSLKRVNIECCNGMRMKDVDYKALKENIFKCDNYPNVEKSKEFTFNIRDNENESSRTYQEFTSKEGSSRSSQIPVRTKEPLQINTQAQLEALIKKVQGGEKINQHHLILGGDRGRENELRITDKELIELLKDSNIKALSIFDAQITDKGLEDSIKQIHGLETLSLAHVHGITGEGLIKALEGKNTINSINIVSCGQICAKHVKELAENLKSGNCYYDNAQQLFRFTKKNYANGGNLEIQISDSTLRVEPLLFKPGQIITVDKDTEKKQSFADKEFKKKANRAIRY